MEQSAQTELAHSSGATVTNDDYEIWVKSQKVLEQRNGPVLAGHRCESNLHRDVGAKAYGTDKAMIANTAARAQRIGRKVNGYAEVWPIFAKCHLCHKGGFDLCDCES